MATPFGMIRSSKTVSRTFPATMKQRRDDELWSSSRFVFLSRAQNVPARDTFRACLQEIGLNKNRAKKGEQNFVPVRDKVQDVATVSQGRDIV